MSNNLYRSRSNRIFAGVAGGLGEYFGIDPTLVRLAFILFTFLGGVGPLVYLILIIVMPEDPNTTTAEVIEEPKITSQPTQRNTLALIMIGVGLVALLNQVLPMSWLSWDNFWPVLLILMGLIFIFRR